jgi:hypothetical protein
MISEKINYKGLFGWLKKLFIGISKSKEINTIEEYKTTVSDQSKRDNISEAFIWYAENPAGYEFKPKIEKKPENMKPLDYNFCKESFRK